MLPSAHIFYRSDLLVVKSEWSLYQHVIRWMCHDPKAQTSAHVNADQIGDERSLEARDAAYSSGTVGPKSLIAESAEAADAGSGLDDVPFDRVHRHTCAEGNSSGSAMSTDKMAGHRKTCVQLEHQASCKGKKQKDTLIEDDAHAQPAATSGSLKRQDGAAFVGRNFQQCAAVRGEQLLSWLRWPLIDGGLLSSHVWRSAELAPFWKGDFAEMIEETMALHLAKAHQGGGCIDDSDVEDRGCERVHARTVSNAGAAQNSGASSPLTVWDPVVLSRCVHLRPEHFRHRVGPAAPASLNHPALADGADKDI